MDGHIVYNPEKGLKYVVLQLHPPFFYPNLSKCKEISGMVLSLDCFTEVSNVTFYCQTNGYHRVNAFNMLL